MPIGLAMPFWPTILRAEGQRCHILWAGIGLGVGGEEYSSSPPEDSGSSARMNGSGGCIGCGVWIVKMPMA